MAEEIETTASLDERFRAGQAEVLRSEAPKGLADRDSRLGYLASYFQRRWIGLQRFAVVRFIGAFAILYTHRRAFGFSAEAAFWATFTLPWLVLGGVSAVSFLAGEEAMAQIQQQVLDLSRNVLNEEAVATFVEPLLNEVVRGSAGVTIVGLLVAIWSGSRVFASFVEGSAALNGAKKRTYLKTRGLALGIYVLGLVSVGILVFASARWPEEFHQALGSVPGGATVPLIGVALLATCALITTMMWMANPRRRKWWYALPGGVLSLLLWLLGSWGLSLYLAWLLREGTLYGAIAAPIAVMLWLFVATLALFIGIALNATILLFHDVLTADEFHLSHRRAAAVHSTGKAFEMARHPRRGRRGLLHLHRSTHGAEQGVVQKPSSSVYVSEDEDAVEDGDAIDAVATEAGDGAEVADDGVEAGDGAEAERIGQSPDDD